MALVASSVACRPAAIPCGEPGPRLPANQQWIASNFKSTDPNVGEVECNKILPLSELAKLTESFKTPEIGIPKYFSVGQAEWSKVEEFRPRFIQLGEEAAMRTQAARAYCVGVYRQETACIRYEPPSDDPLAQLKVNLENFKQATKNAVETCLDEKAERSSCGNALDGVLRMPRVPPSTSLLEERLDHMANNQHEVRSTVDGVYFLGEQSRARIDDHYLVVKRLLEVSARLSARVARLEGTNKDCGKQLAILTANVVDARKQLLADLRSFSGFAVAASNDDVSEPFGLKLAATGQVMLFKECSIEVAKDARGALEQLGKSLGSMDTGGAPLWAEVTGRSTEKPVTDPVKCPVAQLLPSAPAAVRATQANQLLANLRAAEIATVLRDASKQHGAAGVFVGSRGESNQPDLGFSISLFGPRFQVLLRCDKSI